MDAQELRNFQEAYLEVYDNELNEGAAAAVAARAQKLANQRKGQTPERKEIYQNLAKKATARERGPFQRGDTRTGLTQDERDRRREAAVYQADLDGERGRTHGPGSLPRSDRRYFQRVTRGEIPSATADPIRVLRGAAQQREHYDLYDIILSHLLDEGYAETPEAAEVIMVNMSEDWRDSILG
jgi:hypothetical protein